MKYFANFTLSVVVSFLYIIVSRIPIVFRFINSLCSVSSSPFLIAIHRSSFTTGII